MVKIEDIAMNHEEECFICGEISGDVGNDLLARVIGGSYYRRVAAETTKFAVIPSIGPLSPGHVLLCPRTHTRSFLELPEDWSTEADFARRQLKSVLRELFGSPVHCFEHGSALGSARVPCSVEHAHLHFLPTRCTIWEELNTMFDWMEVADSPEAASEVVQGHEYLLYESPEDRVFVSTGPPGFFESQLMRRLFAIALGASERWNWRSVPDPPKVEETFRLVSGYFRDEHEHGILKYAPSAMN